MTEFLTIFFYLLCGHAIADYCLQSDYIARCKSRWSGDPSWFWVLSAHSLTHGAAVSLITGNPLLGFLETAVHWGIDMAKCAGKTNIHQDQTLHVICKVIWAACIVL